MEICIKLSLQNLDYLGPVSLLELPFKVRVTHDLRFITCLLKKRLILHKTTITLSRVS